MIFKCHHQRFWDKVNIKNEDECWEWQSTISTNGYGQFRYYNQIFFAHRVSYTITNGPIPEGKLILHKCDNRLCVNPSHLYCGTQADNINDRAIRSPNSQGSGNDGNISMFSESDADTMKGLYYKDGYFLKSIAEFFNCSVSLVEKIINGKVKNFKRQSKLTVSKIT